MFSARQAKHGITPNFFLLGYSDEADNYEEPSTKSKICSAFILGNLFRSSYCFSQIFHHSILLALLLAYKAQGGVGSIQKYYCFALINI